MDRTGGVGYVYASAEHTPVIFPVLLFPVGKCGPMLTSTFVVAWGWLMVGAVAGPCGNNPGGWMVTRTDNTKCEIKIAIPIPERSPVFSVPFRFSLALPTQPPHPFNCISMHLPFSQGRAKNA